MHLIWEPRLSVPLSEVFFDSSCPRHLPRLPFHSRATPEVHSVEWKNFRSILRDKGSMRLVSRRFNEAMEQEYYKVIWAHHPAHLLKILDNLHSRPWLFNLVRYLRIDFAMPPTQRFPQLLIAPRFPGWPVINNTVSHANLVSRVMHDGDHASYQV